MKDILGTGLFVLLFLFGYMFPTMDLDQSHEREMLAVMIVDNHRQIASFDGLYESDTQDSLKQQLATLYRIGEDAFTITCDDTIKYREETFSEANLIHGTLVFEEPNIISTAAFLGIATEDNKRVHVYDLTVPTEAVRP